MEAMRPFGSKEELPLPESAQQEVIVEPVDEASQALSFAEGEVATKALERQPLIAADIIAKAAEEGKPKEKELEERHEKRGSLDVSQAASVGSIIEKMPPAARQPQQTSKLPTKISTTYTHAPSTSTSKDEDAHSQFALYRQAVRMGFACAVILIVLFVILVVLT